MKSSSAALRSVVYDFPDHLLTDLVTLFFPSGTKRYTTARADITIGSDTWLSAFVKAPLVKQGLGNEIDQVELPIAAPGQTVAGLDFRAAAMANLFSGVRVLIQTARTRTSFTGYAAADLEVLFDGTCTKATPVKDGSVLLRIQSPLSTGRVMASRRVVQASCPFTLGDANCGVTLASYQDTRTIAAGSTAAVIKLSSSSTRAIVGSLVTVKTGGWTGARRLVRAVSGADCTLDVPFAGVEIGATVTVGLTCDKKIATCNSRFSNGSRCGACPNAPAERK